MIARSISSILFIVLSVLANTAFVAAQADRAVLAEGDWLKLAVGDDGLYRITAAQLREAGWNTDEIDPAKLQLYGYGGGMLPQPLDSLYYQQLPENAIQVVGAEGGRFHDEDYVVFYGQSADRLRYQSTGSGYALDYEKNLYADSSYYFLTVGKTDGKRVTTAPSSATSSRTITNYDDYAVYETDEFNLRKPDAGSGREWYGEVLSAEVPREFSLGSVAWSPVRDATVTVEVLGTASEIATLTVALNDQTLGELTIDSLETARYAAKGKEARATFTAPAASLRAEAGKVSFRYQGDGAAYLNKFYVEAAYPLRYRQQPLLFRSRASTTHAFTTFAIADPAEDMLVWDVTDPLQPVRQAGAADGSTWQFAAATQGALREFAAVAPEDLPTVGKLTLVPNQNLKDGVVPNLVIVTPAAFRAEAERLANFRRQHDRLSVRVVTPQQIYNEFASGRQDVSAIRNYMKYLYDTDTPQLQHLLLFGKGSYDYLDRLPNNTNFVPTYQSRNSVHPIYSYSSDDYYAFLEDHEGAWEERYAGDHTMEIGVGRLPVKSADEARTVVDKLIHYATGAGRWGHWRNEVVLVADDGDRNKHQRDAEQLAQRLDTAYVDYSLSKIYLDAFAQEELPGGESSEAARRRIEQVLKRGALIVNFTGHGSETRWTQENIFNLNTISQLRNYDRLPFFVTATCEFGRHDDPTRVSGAEQLVLSGKGGAIGLVTTARPVFSNSNLLLNKAFYAQVFARKNGKPLTIGEIFRRTKNDALNGRVNRNFSLLGDPSMTLAYPQGQVVITRAEVQQSDGTYVARDTLAALDRVRLRGQITDQVGQQQTHFNGTVTVEVRDQPTVIETRGTESSEPMQFEERNAVIHRGRARVRNGQFSLTFVMPHTIAQSVGPGKISTYARSDDSDAHGADVSLVIGGPSRTPRTDQTPPQVQLFLDDTTFVAGGLTARNPILLAYLSDENGIGMVPPTENLVATLVHRESATTTTWTLSEFYETDLDTYQSGTIVYPIDNLAEGHYELSLRAADTYANFTEAQTQFVVGAANQLQVVNFYNYPNPFRTETTFVLDHNRPGDDLALHVRVVDQRGRVVTELRQDFRGSASRLSARWEKTDRRGDGGLLPGLYVAHVRLRSLTEEVSCEKFHKLIISP